MVELYYQDYSELSRRMKKMRPFDQGDADDDEDCYHSSDYGQWPISKDMTTQMGMILLSLSLSSSSSSVSLFDNAMGL